ncbi:lipoate-protein ligase A [Hathewaya proteolytica DSM 3090]|uniref:lipoate--protein ligase n=1 Tax=Hathewaya proteolytica DSM 3090 TaxID=1121331 RepID=A0A1M6SPF2_9CLOT|nr:lipoate--protein ligase [Hathewaya proteolytica]SHK46555.1 lipoate-protein ligase A [Hathewaya proteolytica DSM 3090]
MINKLSYIVSKSTVPYENMALEKYLMDNVAENQCILYLWQNKRTVVIGKNQNAWGECKVSAIENDNGYLARRLSGGGAVFHDLGNLNFTFLVSVENYDVRKQSEVIMNAVRSFGIDVKISGRNDLTVDEKKFSGNAFYQSKGKAYHHGTILIDVDMANMSKYLNVSKDKLQSKGVKSVKSRVVNLHDLNSDVTVEEMVNRLVVAFEETYGFHSDEIKIDTLNQEELKDITKQFEEWEWRLGRKIPFNVEFSHRFSWGNINLQIYVENGFVKDAVVYSDAMESTLVGGIAHCIKGVKYSPDSIATAIKSFFDNNGKAESGFSDEASIGDDVYNYFKEMNF